MSKKEKLEQQLKVSEERAKKAREELAKIRRQERREAEKAERERQAAIRRAEEEEYTRICDMAKTLPSGKKGVSMFDDFRDTVDGFAKRRGEAETQGDGGA